jgi:hypothetical protein
MPSLPPPPGHLIKLGLPYRPTKVFLRPVRIIVVEHKDRHRKQVVPVTRVPDPAPAAATGVAGAIGVRDR